MVRAADLVSMWRSLTLSSALTRWPLSEHLLTMSGSTLVSRAAAQEDDCNYREAPGRQQPLSGLPSGCKGSLARWERRLHPRGLLCSGYLDFTHALRANILVHVIPRPFFPSEW